MKQFLKRTRLPSGRGWGLLILLVLLAVLVVGLVYRREQEWVVSGIAGELAAALDTISELSYKRDMLENQLQIILEPPLTQQNEQQVRMFEHILEYAPDVLGELIGSDVELNSPDSFILLGNNRVLVSGRVMLEDFPYQYIEAIFGFWLGNQISMRLYMFSYGFIGDWFIPAVQSPNQWNWRREHPLETVAVRFYDRYWDWGGLRQHYLEYTTEYLNGENFAQEIAYFTRLHLDRHIIDAWFVGRVLYINLHFNEPMRMSGGTTGETVRYATLLGSLGSIPEIDALVILVGGTREATFGGHGFAFSDIYLVNDLQFIFERLKVTSY